MPPGNVPMSMLPRSQFRPCGLSQRQSRLQPGSRWTNSSDGPEVTGLKQASPEECQKTAQELFVEIQIQQRKELVHQTDDASGTGISCFGRKRC